MTTPKKSPPNNAHCFPGLAIPPLDYRLTDAELDSIEDAFLDGERYGHHFVALIAEVKRTRRS